MKVLVISPYSPSIDSNGIRAKYYCEDIAGMHRDAQILVLADGVGEEDPFSNLKVIRCWTKDQKRWKIINQFKDIINAYDPDIVHLHFNYLTFGGIIKSHRILKYVVNACKKENKRVMVTLHSIISSPVRRITSEIFLMQFHIPGFLDRLGAGVFQRDLDLALEKCDLLIIPSIAAWKFACKRIGQISSQCGVSYLPLGFTINCEPLSKNQRKPKPQNRIHILFYGIITPYKGLHVLLQSVRTLMLEKYEVVLDVMGQFITHERKDAPYYKKIMTLLKKYGLQEICNFHIAHFEESELLEKLGEVDIAVFPTLYDGTLSLSASPYPALFSGAKVVITDSPRLIDFGNLPGVFTSRAGNSTDLADTIIRAASERKTHFDRRAFLFNHDKVIVSNLYFKAYTDLMRG